MILDNKYNFREGELGPDFAKEKLADFKGLINASRSFTVVSMPGVGVSYFLKYLTSKSKVLQASSKIINTASEAGPYFIHIDLYSLPSLNQHEFYRMFYQDLGGKPTTATDEQIFLEIKAILKKLAEKNEKVVVIFSRFDQLRKDFDENFLSNLQSLTTISAGKIVLIFTAIKPLYELAPEAVKGGNLPFYSKIYYFKPFSASDLEKLFTLEHTLKAHPDLSEMIKISGGHNQLLHILLSSQKEQLLLDKFVKMQMKEFVDYLDYHQRKQIQKIALGKKVEEVDDYLLGVGMVKHSTSGFQLFTPLLSEYIKTNLPVKLPAKEAKLFKLLRKNMGRTVPKDEIFAEVWPENSEDATDWALDALIYRLRKHSFIQANNFVIESHKKVGYTLIQT